MSTKVIFSLLGGLPGMAVKKSRDAAEEQKKQTEQMAAEIAAREKTLADEKSAQALAKKQEEEDAKAKLGSRLALISTSSQGILGSPNVGRGKLLGN